MTASPSADALLDAARLILDDSFANVRSLLDCPAEGLNWRPDAPETNSLAAIASHALSSARAWLLVVRGTPQTDRQRGAELATFVQDAAAFRSQAEAIMSECVALLDSTPRPFDAAVMRHSHARRDPNLAHEMTAAWALLHVVDHLREHVGQMMLTRSLWEAQRA